MCILQALMGCLSPALPRTNVLRHVPNHPLYQAVAESDLTERGMVKRSRDRHFLGGCSDIYQGTLRLEGSKVKIALKVMRFRGRLPSPLTDADYKVFYMEVLVCSRLNHPNIAEFKGFTMPTDPTDMPTIILRWYKHGDILSWLEKNRSVDRLLLLRDVVSGVQYLHSVSVIHGDLKAANVLIDDQRRARLCDFGTSHIVSNLPVGLAPSDMVSPSELGYTVRYSSPELQMDEVSTPMSDIWAVGCVAMQILANVAPYANQRSDDAARISILRGNSPVNVTAFSPQTPLVNTLIGDIATCWDQDPLLRPSAEELLERIDALRNQGLTITRPFE
ncbi:hypothetical protein FRC03_009135 [Tulasnella sp. 419]|nr:hypothetical protein FRC03_009135 [Tulasnella sp. 419]